MSADQNNDGLGRPTKLTKVVHGSILKALAGGAFPDTAFAYAGVSRATGRRWLKRGRDEIERVDGSPHARIRSREKIYVEFAVAVERALAQAETRSGALIAKAAEKNWRAAGWLLERRWPERWAKREHVTHDVPQMREISADDLLSIQEKAKAELKEWEDNLEETEAAG